MLYERNTPLLWGNSICGEEDSEVYRAKVDSPVYEIIQLYQLDKFQFYGTVAGKPPNSKLYKVQLDLLPSDCNEILVVHKDITVLATGEEEPPYYPHHDALVEECKVVADKPAPKKSHDYIGESYKSFANLESDLQAVASNFELIYGKDVKD